MKSKTLSKKLGLNKTTVANLNTNEMRFIYGGGLDPGHKVTYTCSCPDPSYIESYEPSHC
jgi:natural product precursor